MPVSLQADYDHLRQLARELGYHADDVYATLVRLQYHLDVLTSGGWIGYAADRFFDEMHADIFPFLNQFNAELTQTGVNIANLVELFQQTDDNLRPYFQSTDGTQAAYYLPGNTKYSTVKLERADSAPNLGSWSKVDGLEVNMDIIEGTISGDPNLKQSGDPHGAAP